MHINESDILVPKPWSSSNDLIAHYIQIEIEGLTKLSNKKEIIDEDNLSELLKEKMSGRIFNLNQEFNFKLEMLTLRLIVRKISRIITKNNIVNLRY